MKKKLNIFTPKTEKMDMMFFFFVIALLITGLIMLFSASYSYALTYQKDSFHFIKRQLFFALLGLVGMMVISRIDYHIFKKLSVPIYIFTVILLVAVYAFPAISNVHRWITIGPVQFQPSEIAKVSIIIIFASLISKNYKRMNDIKFIAILVGLLILIFGLVIGETHVSAAILIALIGIAVIYVGGLSNKLVILGTGLAAIGVTAVYFVLKYFIKYASSRIDVWRDPWSFPTKEGYQTIQSLLAVGSGGIFGRGLGQSRQKYLWVPEPHNDFIFSIVCEELGLIGAVAIIIGFCLLVWRGCKIGMRSKDKFGSLLAMGIVFQVGLQTALNIMVVTNTIPNTGISLPFFSYGGSSLFFLLCEMGIVLNISRYSSIEKA